ncbi:transcriptional regulator, LuxR family [Nitrosospira multiformis ATCC 25196]|uniref:Transcriptional regulator, LuxR family n=1 Tax=Nitrosospira multiformis (strain ATCC 25196 / NCIMB 11849 / C 71) TaxID=323848 RepID=Q2Y6R4_NITMU|nr:transcriptional regulator, LuxR family [Nitrosospira multiformis ATCC 25196]
MILLYGISPHWSKSAIKKNSPHLREEPGLALFSTCPVPWLWNKQLLFKNSQGLNPIYFINKERGQQGNTGCGKAVLSRIPAPRWVEILLPYIDAAFGRIDPPPRNYRHTPVPLNPEEVGFSPREIAIMEWIRRGKTIPETAAILEVSTFTVKNCLLDLFQKLHAADSGESTAEQQIRFSH